MTRFEAWLQHLANILVAGTGMAYAWYRYLEKPADGFSAVHPLLPLWQSLHVLAAPLLVFACAFIWRSHVLTQLDQKQGRKKISGWVLLLPFVPMVMSGYLAQVVTEDLWRGVWAKVHLGTSAIWIVGYGTHLLPGTRRGRRRAIR